MHACGQSVCHAMIQDGSKNHENAYKTIQRVSVPDLKLFGPMNTELWAIEVRKFSVTLYVKMGWWAFFSQV